VVASALRGLGQGLGLALSVLCAAAPGALAAPESPSFPDLGGIFERTPEFDFEPPAPGSYELAFVRRAPDGEVLNSDGRRHRFSRLTRGRIVLLSFIYTRCADARGCPLATATLYDIFEASALDPELAGALALVSLSFDPAHDTPSVMKDYGFAAFHAPRRELRAPWLFLTTASEDALKPLLDGFGQTLEPRHRAARNESAFDHLLRVYLVDRRGWVRNVYGLGFLDPRLVVADIRTLLLEDAEGGKQPR
jgi:protein SCO1/2